MKKLFIVTTIILFCRDLTAQTITHPQYRNDFNFFWTTIKTDYCYWYKKQTDWEKVKNIYSPLVDTITSKRSFVLLLEKVFYELYDHHASLSTNTRESQRLVPTHSDIWAEYINGKPVITEVRLSFGAQITGLKPGMQIIAYNNILVDSAIKSFLPKSLKT